MPIHLTDKSSLKQTFTKLANASKRVLAEYEFDEHVEYEDSLGGLVLDSYRNDERITSIVSNDSIQMLSYVDGSITTKEFKVESDSVLNAIEYLRLFLDSGRKTKQLRFSKDTNPE